MSNFMVLGANTLQIPLITKVNEMGYDSIAVSPDKNEPGFEIAKHKVYLDITDEEAILKVAKEYDIVGIMTDQTDIAVRTVAYVAEKMGLPGIGYETACLFTDKSLMREKCKEIGVKTLEYKLVTNLEEALEFYRSINMPVIIKPVDNQGSRGVSVAETEDKLIEKFEEAIQYSRSKKVLVEQFVIGREFTIEGVTFNYETKTVAIGDSYYFDIPDVFSSTSRKYPTNADDALVKRLIETNEKIVNGFGLKQGITHSEYIMNGEDIILIESAARGGGVFISSDLIPISSGLRTEEFLVNIATGKCEKMPEFEYGIRACCYVAFYLPVGEVIDTSGIEQALSLSYTHRHNLNNIKIGLKTRPYTDKTSRYFIIVDADNREMLDERIKEIRNILDGIKVMTDAGVKTPIWE